MRRVAAGAAVVLLLAGCDTRTDHGGGKSKSPSATQSSTQAATADLGAVCDALGEAVKLPNDGTVRYNTKFNKPTEWATNAPVCEIEPDGEYYDVATKAPVFGRAKFNYSVLTEAERQQVKYPRYSPESAERLLTLDQVQPLVDNRVPCVNEPCKDGINGYFYDFRFETVMDDISVNAKFDYLTTDVGGDKKPQYRAEAVKAFIATMDTIAARL